MVAYLRTLIATALLLVLSACGGGSGSESTFKPSNGADTTAPEIMSTTPADNSLSVSDSAAVVIRFNESLKSYSVNFKLVEVNAEAEIEGFVNYHDDLKSVVFTPREPLKAETQYLAKLIGAEDLAGNSVSAMDISFTTEPVALERPNILIQPLAKDLFAGDTIDLRVVLSNLNDVTSFAWFRDTSSTTGESLGQFTNNLVIEAVLASDSGYYYCKITNSAGEVQTIPVYVGIKKPLVVGQQPQSVTSLAGRSITFSGQFDGSENKTLQWFKDGQALEESAKYVGVDEAILRVNNINSSDAGSYVLTATTDSASLSTQAASLVVINPVVITQGLSNQTVAEQTQLNLSVSAEGTGPLQYSWFHNNVLIEQESGASLNISSIAQVQAGTYKVTVRNAYSSQTSSASVVVLARAAIEQQPVDVSVFAGSSASLEVGAVGSELSYQWQKQDGNQWQDIDNANSAVLNFVSVANTDAGDYRVVVSNDINTVISSVANIYVGQGASITQQPQSQLVQTGANASFGVVASGESLQYEWRKNGQLIAGENGAQLHIANAGNNDQATYQCRVWNANNSVNCAQVSLTVAQSLAITKQPQSTTVYAGEWVNIKVTASGYQPSYRWYKNGSLLSGQTGENLSLGTVTASDAGSYYAEVYNQYGSVNSATSVVTVKQATSIISQPSAQTVNEGASINLSVNAQGSDLNYEWRRNGQVLAGENSSSLTISGAQSSDAGSYQCRVWNDNNSVNCNSATVSVRAAVSIASQTNSLTINEGQSTTLSVVANGYQASYRWYKGNQVIAGANSNQLILNNITVNDAASYKCEVYNSFSSEQCDAIDLSVVAKPVINSQSPSQQVQFGDDLTLAVNASGTATLTYQWYKDGAALAGETGNQLSLSNVQAANLGSYVCRVSNGAGSADSQAIELTGVETYSVEVSWAKPTQREDGSALSDNEIDGYKVYMQISSGEFELIETNLGANNTSAVVGNLYPGSYTFKVRTLDSDGQESGDSELQSIDL